MKWVRESSKHNKDCIKCKHNFVWFPEQAWWDYSGTSDTKLVRCPECGCIQSVQYKEQINPNYDRRAYGFK